MSTLQTIRALGAEVRLAPGDKLVVAGLDRLPRERAEAALSLAAQHRPALVAALRCQTWQPPTLAPQAAPDPIPAALLTDEVTPVLWTP